MAIEEEFLPGAETEDLLNDGWLLMRAKEGDKRSFELLYARHYDSVYRICRSRSSNPFVAEELTQEVFIKAFRSVHSLRAGTPMHRWLMRVARNTCIDYLRALTDREISLDSTREMIGLSAHADPTADDVVAKLTRRRLLQVANRALDSLEPCDRRLLLLRDVEGRSYEELARSEGVTKHALRNRVWRTRARLHTTLRSFVDEVRSLSLVAAMSRLRPARAHTANLQDKTTRSMTRACRRAPSLAGAGALLLAFGVVLGIQVFTSSSGQPSRPAVRLPSSVEQSSYGPDQPATPTNSSRGQYSSNPGVLMTEFQTHKRPDAVLPNHVGFRVEVRWPRGKLLIGVGVGTDCVGGESDVLPSTGVATVYC